MTARATIPRLKLRRLRVPLFLAVSGWVVLGLTVVVGPGPIRWIAVFAFALLGPGTAVIRLLPLRDFLERAVLAVALSLSLVTLTAEAVAIAHILSAVPVLVILASICTAAALVGIARELNA
jgi:uncharacterized membrane protein